MKWGNMRQNLNVSIPVKMCQSVFLSSFKDREADAAISRCAGDSAPLGSSPHRSQVSDGLPRDFILGSLPGFAFYLSS